ncbi:MAG: T9SS type A sorting domain-containing protein, partial [Muribaculaceae bacterium]|nr:T9SS type A sorting domain-containing protein [Muribaculaceae bacterium]
TLPAGVTANVDKADGIFFGVTTITDFVIPEFFWNKMPTRMFYIANDAVERTFTCRSMTPPVATEASANGTFSNVADMPNTTVKVPYKAMDIYKETAPWSGMNVEAVTVPVMLTVEHPDVVEPGHVTVSFVVEDVEHPHLAPEVIEGDGKLVISFSDDAHEMLYVKEVRRNTSGVNMMAEENEDDEPIPGWENIYVCSDPENSMKQTVEIPMSVNADMGAHHVVIETYNDSTSIVDINAANGAFKRVGSTIVLAKEGAELFDTAGRQVAATSGTELSLAGLAGGVYILKVQEKTIKIVK